MQQLRPAPLSPSIGLSDAGYIYLTIRPSINRDINREWPDGRGAYSKRPTDQRRTAKEKQHASTRHQANPHRSVLSSASTVFFFWRNNSRKPTKIFNGALQRTSCEAPQALALPRLKMATSACSLD